MPTKNKRKPNPRPLYAPSPEAAELAWQRLSDPDAWHARLAAVMEKEGTVRGAAAKLGVSAGVIQRAVRDDPRLERYLKPVGNPGFGPGYGAGKTRGKYKPRKPKTTRAHKKKEK